MPTMPLPLEQLKLEQLKRMCLHKRVYESRAEARRIARQTQHSPGDRKHHCHAYQCSNCGFWHVTSQVRSAG